jgi:hypothetical protein
MAFQTGLQCENDRKQYHTHEKLEKFGVDYRHLQERSLDSLTQQMGMSSSLEKNETELLYFIGIT